MERLGRTHILRAACALAVALGLAAQAGVIHVDDDATGANDGSSWADAFVHLQDALAAAQVGDEIRVAQGTYTPDRGASVEPGDTEVSFALVSGVAVHGGYVGGVFTNADARDIEQCETTLSGDLNGDDGPDFANRGDNSQNVVTSVGSDATTVLDGFTVTGGWGPRGPGITCLESNLRISNCTIEQNKTRGTQGHGAGIHRSGGHLTLSHCVFRGNWAWADGGGLYSERGDLVLTDCLFEANTAVEDGGGLYGSGTIVLERCTFRYNEGRHGVGMYVSAGQESLCADSVFADNAAGVEAGGGGSGGGCYATGSRSMTFRACCFSDNLARNGGGLATGSCGATIIDCTFRRNVAWDDGGAITNHGPALLEGCQFIENRAARGGALYTCNSAPTLRDCLLKDNVAKGEGAAVCTVRIFPRRSGSGPADMAPTLVNCRLVGNRAIRSFGGGLYSSNNGTVLVNCLLIGNAADGGGGLYTRGVPPTLVQCTLAHNRGGLGGAMSDETGGTIVDHCIVWGNDDSQISGHVVAEYSDIQGGWPGAGNLDVDPLFAAPGRWDPNGTPDSLSDDFWVDGDYHLQSRGGRWDPDSASWVQDEVTSPCVDAGSAESDVADEPFPNGGIVNLGAYGGTIEASKTDLGPIRNGSLIVYVDDDAVASGDGLTWATALRDLQDAIGGARPGDEIRVAQGTYLPTSNPLDREATFELKPGMIIRGGYAGLTAMAPDTWDPNVFATILSGDIDRNDYFDDPNSKNGNSYHVLTCRGLDNRAVLESIIVTGGKADKACSHCFDAVGGGGLLCLFGCSPHLIDCVFFDNQASGGGAVWLRDAYGPTTEEPSKGGQWQPVFTRCLFLDNTASFSGGAVHNGRRWRPEFDRCVWENNAAVRHGGAIECAGRSDLTLTHCVLRRNGAGRRGGAISAGLIGEIQLVNCLLVANAAGDVGGAIAHPDAAYGGDDPYALRLLNCTLYGHTSPTLYRPPTVTVERPDESRTSVTATLVANCIIYGSVVELDGGEPLSFGSPRVAPQVITSILDPGLDPLFVDPEGVDSALGTADDDFRLAPHSPAIGAGTHETGLPLPAQDLDGNPRIIDTVIDLGAYESFSAAHSARGRRRR